MAKELTPEEKIANLEKELAKSKEDLEKEKSKSKVKAAAPTDWNVETAKGARVKVSDDVLEKYKKKKKLGSLKFKTLK